MMSYTWPPNRPKRRRIEADPREIATQYFSWSVQPIVRRCEVCGDYATTACASGSHMHGRACRKHAKWVRGKPYCSIHVPRGE